MNVYGYSNITLILKARTYHGIMNEHIKLNRRPISKMIENILHKIKKRILLNKMSNIKRSPYFSQMNGNTFANTTT